MKRIDTATKAVDKFGAGKHGFTNGNVVSGIPATDLTDSWFDNVQEELANVVEAAGLTLKGDDRTQVLQAIRSGGVFQTPAQFDASTKVATTAFVQRALGNMRGCTSYIGDGKTIAASDVGGLVLYQSTTAGQSLYLPSLASLPAGSMVCISGCGGGFPFALLAQGGQDIVCRANFSTSLSLLTNDSVILVSESSTRWNVIGGSYEATKSPRFGASMGNFGYQKLPSGLIMQWGSGSTALDGRLQVFFPVAFPSACFGITATHIGGALAAVIELVGTRSQSSTWLKVIDQYGGTGAWGLSWFALGY